MTLHQFRIFSAIAKCGNLTKAALELRVSQPAISHQLRLLQKWYGTALYARTPVGVELTDAGRKLLGGILPILAQVAELETGAHASPPPNGAREVLRIGVIESVSAHLLPAVLAQFQRRYPAVELRFRSQTSERLEAAVLSAAVNLAVTGRFAPSADLVSEPLRREPVALFVPANHRLAKQARLKLSDLVSEPLIVRGGIGGFGVTDGALRQLREGGLKLKIGMQCDGPSAIKAAVRQRMGVGIVFQDSLKAEVAAGEFKILKFHGLDLAGESFVVYSKKRPLSHLAQEFLALLRSAATPRRKEIANAPRRLRLITNTSARMVDDGVKQIAL